MSEETNTEELDSQNQPTEEVVNTEEVETEAPADEVEDLEKLREQNKKLFERAKKAEELAKQLKAKTAQEPKATTQTPEKQGEQLSSFDTIALIDAKVTNKEDIEFVAEYARFKRISVADALKSSVVRGELSERAETRRTAEVTNTGSSKRTTAKVSDDVLLKNAADGKLPEDPEALAQAYYRQKLGSK